MVCFHFVFTLSLGFQYSALSSGTQQIPDLFTHRFQSTAGPGPPPAATGGTAGRSRPPAAGEEYVLAAAQGIQLPPARLQTPAASPARAAAPKAVVSTWAGRSTGSRSRSAWVCIMMSLTEAPPSTRRVVMGQGRRRSWPAPGPSPGRRWRPAPPGRCGPWWCPG